ncbi:MAG TPA: efflux RND transporter periplasmic adaptor subunit [Bryobacteraceae bacterium]|nr:efflux RND transporter periplasmic adaptor subunit [Bryobacteraceae bacterium]
MKSAFLGLSCLPLALLMAACGSDKAAEVKTAPPAPVAISTATVSEREVPADFEETGTFIAEEISQVAPVAAGRVIATPVDVGARVHKGEVICELDPRDAQLRLDQAKAQLAEATANVRQMQSRIGLSTASNSAFNADKVPEVAAAHANYESAQANAKLAAADAQRYVNLAATGDVSASAVERARTQQETAEAQVNAARQQYEAAANTARQSSAAVSTSEASLDAVKAQVAQAEKALADTKIRAPFDGFITARPVAAGEYVALQDKIATIVRIGTVKLDLQTPEQRASLAHVGDKVIARVAAFPAREFKGKVIAVNASVDPNSRAFILEAAFENADGALKPGMFATAHVQLAGTEKALFVPKQAVQRDKTTDSNQVFTISDGKAHLRVVAIEETNGDEVRLASGVTGGEVVATSKLTELYDGAPVTTGGAK